MMTFEETIQKLRSGQINVGLTKDQRLTWVPFAHHFTDIMNAVSILKMGRLVSRHYASIHGIMKNDNASPEIIAGTANDVEDLVRLYFRPRTPTQFRNEGFRVAQDRTTLHASCPVPVFFLFDLTQLLQQTNVRFTNCSLAVSHPVPQYATPQEFAGLPFDKIYHNQAFGGLTDGEKREIVRCRHAEIIVPNELSLRTLRWILVRSVAEKETLLSLLHESGITQYDKIIRIGHQNFFFGSWNYVESVDLNDDGIILHDNVNHAYPADWGEKTLMAINAGATDRYLRLRMRVDFLDLKDCFSEWPQVTDSALFRETIKVKFLDGIKKGARKHYRLRVWLNDHIAYQGEYNGFDEPNLPF